MKERDPKALVLGKHTKRNDKEKHGDRSGHT